jgi:hypothetical protein
MQKTGFDPGLTQQFTGQVRQFINKDGSFNVRRSGSTWRDFHPYMILVHMRWVPFLACVALAYLVVNSMFALVYYAFGPGQLHGVDETTNLSLDSARFGPAFNVDVRGDIVLDLERLSEAVQR